MDQLKNNPECIDMGKQRLHSTWIRMKVHISRSTNRTPDTIRTIHTLLTLSRTDIRFQSSFNSTCSLKRFFKKGSKSRIVNFRSDDRPFQIPVHFYASRGSLAFWLNSGLLGFFLLQRHRLVFQMQQNQREQPRIQMKWDLVVPGSTRLISYQPHDMDRTIWTILYEPYNFDHMIWIEY